MPSTSPPPAVSLFVTCLTDQFYPRAGQAVVLVLEALGYAVDFPAAQTCCGQPMYNTGRHDDARALALRMLDIFEHAAHVVTPSASCAAMVREHNLHLFHQDPANLARAKALAAKTFEFAEFLAKVVGLSTLRAWMAGGEQRTASSEQGKAQPVPAVRHSPFAAPSSSPFTFHPSCHQRSLGPSSTPSILALIPGLDLRPLNHAEQCCGFGGAFAIKHPEISGPMVEEKVRDIAAALGASGAGTLICNDAGCAMNIEGACRRSSTTSPPRTLHLAEVLAEAMGLLPGEGAEP